MNARGVLVLAAFLCGSVCAETLPQSGTVDPRIRTAVYSPDQVYRLYGYVGFHIDLEFEADETFASLSGGDLEGLTYSAHANVLTLKPKVPYTEMNLAVTTSKRRYYFEYSASAHRPNPDLAPVMYAVRFTYPPAKPSGDGLTDEERLQLELAKGRQNRPRNTDYWFCGNPAVRPPRRQTVIALHQIPGIPRIVRTAADVQLPERFPHGKFRTLHKPEDLHLLGLRVSHSEPA